MIGAIIGDIVGSRFEMINYSANKSFEDYKSFPLFTDKSKFTDDTVLTLAIADCIVNDKEFHITLKEYGRKYPLAGYGGSFIQWLDSPGFEPYNSYGNGSAMRVSPVGFFYSEMKHVLEVAQLTAMPTHNHPEGIKGAQAIAACIYMARTGASKAEIKEFVVKNFGYDLNRTLDQIRPTYEFSATCQLTVPEAIIAFLESDDYESAIRKAISIGGDSDTLACMAGSVAEAFYGTESLLPFMPEAYQIIKTQAPELMEKLDECITTIYV